MKTVLDFASYFLADSKEVRLPLRFIYSNGRSISASNGHMLIQFETKKYKEGYYLPIGLQVLLDDKYPDIPRVLSIFDKSKLEEVSLKDGQVEEGKENYLHFASRYFDAYFDKQYINKIKKLGKDVEVFITSNEYDKHAATYLFFSGIVKDEDGVDVPFRGMLAPCRV